MKKIICLVLILTATAYGNSTEENPFNIGNTYFEHKQYPWAVLYYARALKENPQNALAREYLSLAREQLPGPKKEVIIERPDHHFGWFFTFLLLAFLFGSWAIWNRKKLFWALSGSFAMISLGFLFYATIIFYFTPIPALMVESSALYRGKGKEFGIVGDKPLFAGSSIGVIDVEDGGTWLKVETEEGVVGYLLLKSLRII